MDKEYVTFIYRHDSIFKKKEILQFTATWVNLEDILPYKPNTKTNPVWSYLHVESQKVELTVTE